MEERGSRKVVAEKFLKRLIDKTEILDGDLRRHPLPCLRLYSYLLIARYLGT